MAKIPCSLQDKENRKFIVDQVTGDTTIRVSDLNNPASIAWARIEVSQPDDVTEVYEYLDAASSLLLTITIVYLDATKTDIDYVTRV